MSKEKLIEQIDALKNTVINGFLELQDITRPDGAWSKEAGQYLVYGHEQLFGFHRGAELCANVESSWKKSRGIEKRKEAAKIAIATTIDSWLAPQLAKMEG